MMWFSWLLALPYLIPHWQTRQGTVWVNVASDERLQRVQIFVNPYDTTTRHRTSLPYWRDAAWEFWDRKNQKDTLLKLPMVLPPGMYRFQVSATRENGDRIHSRWYGFSWDGADLGPAIDLGPYLFYPSPETAVVRVRFFKAQKGILELPDTTLPLYPVDGLPSWLEARVPVQSGHPLTYRVCTPSSQGICSAWYEGVTPPPSGQPVIFAALGDTRSGWSHPASTARTNLINVPVLNMLLHHALRHGVQALLILGDLVHGYTEDTTFVRLQYETWLQATEPVSGIIPIFPVMGNHDATAPFIREKNGFRWRSDRWAPERVWARYFELPQNGPQALEGNPPYAENVYWIQWGDLVWVALNSDYRYELREEVYTARRVDARQRRWLEEVLRRFRGKTVVVGVHEPLFPVGRHRGRSLDAWPKDRDALLGVLRRFRVGLVLVGHEHLYARVTLPGSPPITQIITGRGGSPLYRDILFPIELPYGKVEVGRADEHVVLCSLEDKSLMCQVINLAGFTVDTFRILSP